MSILRLSNCADNKRYVHFRGLDPAPLPPRFAGGGEHGYTDYPALGDTPEGGSLFL